MNDEKKLTGYPSVDKPWLKYYSEEDKTAPLPADTVYEYMHTQNEGHHSDIALMIEVGEEYINNSKKSGKMLYNVYYMFMVK